MAYGSRSKGERRDGGGFVALPWSVLDSPAYLNLSSHAKALLMEFARQLRGDNNGALLCSRAYLATRGWKSNDMMTKCRDELVDAGLIHQTVMGCRPNRASWYAVTWIGLDKLIGLDPDLARAFVRGAYRTSHSSVTQPLKMRSLSRPTGQRACL